MLYTVLGQNEDARECCIVDFRHNRIKDIPI